MILFAVGLALTLVSVSALARLRALDDLESMREVDDLGSVDPHRVGAHGRPLRGGAELSCVILDELIDYPEHPHTVEVDGFAADIGIVRPAIWPMATTYETHLGEITEAEYKRERLGTWTEPERTSAAMTCTDTGIPSDRWIWCSLHGLTPQHRHWNTATRSYGCLDSDTAARLDTDRLDDE
jgi:hypothetical protein